MHLKIIGIFKFQILWSIKLEMNEKTQFVYTKSRAIHNKQYCPICAFENILCFD